VPSTTAPTTQQRLFEQAAALIGTKELAAGLKVSEALLECWIDGRTAVPHRELLKLAELLVELASKTKQV
jgi:hypothetical protein